MRRSLLILFAAAAFCVTAGRADAQVDPCATARSLRAPAPATAVTPAEVCRVLAVLADDSLQGRLTGTAGADRAARFIADELQRAGLEPAGEDGGWFQRVPLVMRRGQDGRTSPAAVPSFAARDTFPVDRRGVSLNVLGLLRGSDPVLRDSVVLVDAHYDHLGLAATPIDVDSTQAMQDLSAPIRAEFDAWLQSSGVAARAERGVRDFSPAERATINEFNARIGAVRVDMDSLRRAHPVARRDSIFNGADDDASGITAVIEIARQLAGTRPRRSILFAATTGEEVGLIGTDWYIAHPVVPNAAIQANLEIEMIGRPDPLVGGAGRAWLTGFERSTMGATLRDAGLPVAPDPYPGQNFFERSDNIAFAQMGIPAHTLSSFALHTDYHQVTDELAGIDLAHMAGVVDAAVKAVALLANGRAPEWNPGGKP